MIATRAVTLHAPNDCAAGLRNLDSSAYGTYQAMGDFEAAPVTSGHAVLAGLALPEIDAETRALLVVATESDRKWEGVSEVSPQGPVDVLLLPAMTSCALRGSVRARTNPVMASIGGQRLLLVGGATDGSETAPTLVLRLDTGAIEPLVSDLATPRERATVTPFGRGALVAGGIRSVTHAPLDTAEVYDSTRGGFDSHVLRLSSARAGAGSVVLATGETLLVGGVGQDGTTATDSMEVVDPLTRAVRTQNVARLAVGRSAPTVLRLASGEILVAGGVATDGTAVASLEWFSPDASRRSRRSQILEPGAARAYGALEGGGALAVIVPPANADPTFQNVWVIDADGSLEPAAPIAGSLTRPVIFAGPGGAPLVWTGDRWLRWQPWRGAFGAFVTLDDRPVQVGAVTASAVPGLALWFEATGLTTTQLQALVFDSRGIYSPLGGALLVSGTDDMSPDRLATDGVVSFDRAVGLKLAPSASAFIDDRTYADVRVEVDAPTGDPAVVVLRTTAGSELEVGGPTCPGAIVTGTPSTLTVERRGANVTWTLSGGLPSKLCVATFGAADRISIGMRGARDLRQSVARNLRVVRLSASSSQ